MLSVVMLNVFMLSVVSRKGIELDLALCLKIPHSWMLCNQSDKTTTMKMIYRVFLGQ